MQVNYTDTVQYRLMRFNHNKNNEIMLTFHENGHTFNESYRYMLNGESEPDTLFSIDYGFYFNVQHSLQSVSKFELFDIKSQTEKSLLDIFESPQLSQFIELLKDKTLDMPLKNIPLKKMWPL
jgi:hypothetical protein